MENNKLAMVLLLICVFYQSCTSSTMNYKEYLQYVESEQSGYKIEKHLHGWRYIMQYQPPEYRYCKTVGAKGFSVDELKNQVAKSKGWVFVNLSVSHDSIRSAQPIRLISSSRDDYTQKNNYYLIENAGNFSMVDKGRRITPVVFQYENSYNLSPNDVFVIGFKTDEDRRFENDLTIEYNDVLLQNGIVRFILKKDDLNALKNIKI